MDKYYEIKGNLITLTISQYAFNNALAVIVMTNKGETFAVLTVNIADSDNLKPTEAFIDTNNVTWAEKFLTENNIAKPTGRVGTSGFCTYPCYDFSEYLRSH